MFKYRQTSNTTMNANASASVSAFACNCSETNSANKGILRILDAGFAVSIFAIMAMARIINEIIISLLAIYANSPVSANA